MLRMHTDCIFHAYDLYAGLGVKGVNASPIVRWYFSRSAGGASRKEVREIVQQDSEPKYWYGISFWPIVDTRCFRHFSLSTESILEIAEILQKLESSELDFIQRAMVAAAHGGFFPDWEVSILFGIERADLLQVIEQWPEPEVCGDDLRAAIVGSLNLLSGYPHGLEEELLSHLPEGREAISEMMRRGEIFIRIRELQKQLDEMVEIASAVPFRTIGPDNVEAWAGSLKNHDFYNQISLMLAESYASGKLGYGICDAIVNGLFRVLVNNSDNGRQFPEPFFEIFEAFDAGEYHRKPYKSDDPVGDHTDPWIAEILSRPSHPMT